MKKLTIATTATLSLALIGTGVVPATAATPDDTITIAALGDSISQGFNADGNYGNQPQYSWSTGDNVSVNSHNLRLQSQGKIVTAHNFSVAGTSSIDLNGQAASAVAANADYVTILSGANDVCGAPDVASLPSAATYKANVKAALETIKNGNSETKVFLASIPSLMKLYNAGKTSPTATATWTGFGICQVMLGSPEDTSAEATARRATVENKVTELNVALSQVCAEYAHCFYDDNAVNSIDFELADLSPLDYFHPSIVGQNKVAAATWNVVTTKNIFANPVVKPTIRIVAPTKSTVSGVVTAKIKATSDSPITAVSAKFSNNKTVKLVKKSDGLWYVSVNTKNYRNGNYSVQFSATDKDGDIQKTQAFKFTVKN
jgi:lysophospholipase L1-like esterase